MIIRPLGSSETVLDWAELIDQGQVNHLRTTLAKLTGAGSAELIEHLHEQPSSGHTFSLLHVSVTPADLAHGIDVDRLRSVFNAGSGRIHGIALDLDVGHGNEW